MENAKILLIIISTLGMTGLNAQTLNRQDARPRFNTIERESNEMQPVPESRISKFINLLEQKHATLKELIISGADKRDIADMEHAIAAIQKLEEENGITDLQAKFGRLRVTACEMQQQGPIPAYTEKIKALTQEIKKLTKPERDAIDQLMQEIKNSSPTTRDARRLQNTQVDDRQNANTQNRQQTALQKSIKAREDAMRLKIQKQLEAIEELNEKIYQELGKEIEMAKPLAMALKEKYTALQDTLKPLDTQIARAIKSINARLEPQANAIKKLKQEIRDLRDTILEIDPCFVARESMRQSTWESFFI